MTPRRTPRPERVIPVWSRAFWQDAAERAAKTGVQTLIPAVTVALVSGAPDWGDLANGAGFAACAAGISLLTSVGSAFRGDEESASLVKPEVGRHARPA